MQLIQEENIFLEIPAKNIKKAQFDSLYTSEAVITAGSEIHFTTEVPIEQQFFVKTVKSTSPAAIAAATSTALP